MKLDSFFKVGKDVLMEMTRVQNSLEFDIAKKNFEEENIKTEINSFCTNCSLHIKDISEVDINVLRYKEEYCLNHCPKRKNYIKNKDNYLADNFIGFAKKRLSRLQLCQLLLYHALEVGSTGLIRNVSEKEIASILDCTVKTVRNNNKRLVNFGYIILSKSSRDRFGVLLKDYNKYHLSAQQGGRGYVVMSNKTLMELLNIKNVNSLRITIRNLVKFDDNNIKRIKTREAICTYNETSFFLPDYINHKAIIDRILEETFSMFNYRKVEDKIYFKLKDEYDGKNQRRKLGNKYKLYFKNYCKKRCFNLTSKDYDDLIQMSLEYRFKTVIQALDIAYENYLLKDIEVENYGGLVREIIKNKAYEKKLA